ncbi:hypothetical protein HYFRA_00009119 [Hymenoscyphus fraxineus]|uniref:Stress-response A/B barrel domain-containing protein n=1 Tax=Hymenoscyphus fraxineus TaxID=746836 RepID=A0A9N9PI65_9HELO|nr:hypothetical protein HYFRA_00009119 [Hymenoscyphus fraxineus]
MGITHMIFFKFKDSASKEEVSEASKNLIALAKNCIHPTTNAPYILSSTGGENISNEGMSGEFTHGFVSQFANKEDMEYYLRSDPAHMAFIKSVGAIAEKAQVIDYEDGKY